MQSRYVVMLGRGYPAGKLDSPDPQYTYYYKTYEEAEAEGKKWLDYTPPTDKKELKKIKNHSLKLNFFSFSIEKIFYTDEHCEKYFNDDGSQKI